MQEIIVQEIFGDILHMILIAFFIFGSMIMIIGFFNKRLPIWACTKLGWHLQPKSQGFDGASSTGVCPRCHKDVLQDSQGNWF